VEQRRQGGRDAVAPGQIAEHLDARHRETGVEELMDDLEHPALLGEHGTQRLQLLVPAQRLGTGASDGSMST